MGRRGPAPKPTIIQLKRGDPGKRAKKRAKKEPMPPEPRIETPPSWMKGRHAKAEWRRVLEMFREMEANGQKVITEADMTALAAYCQTYQDYVTAIKTLADEGETFTTEKGYVGAHPSLATKNKSLMALKQYSEQFGFTPASRGRLQIEKANEEDDSEKKIRSIIGF